MVLHFNHLIQLPNAFFFFNVTKKCFIGVQFINDAVQDADVEIKDYKNVR